ncbi:beta strand repeat-containing protein [Planctomicrobium piriforme]|uniref:Autotransporter-associated beta strand repeat-containing protein n=1 Tax=Planctomicrobium piriforme TaxID=1576369 RepID=A0A1I3NP25_9PLAN|nr:hypothetical protein [Planctomicrobium piriforme]SFJ10690.1 hypothetical protein SAMN05421753_115149 [Planctomicrobium piriforme]
MTLRRLRSASVNFFKALDGERRFRRPTRRPNRQAASGRFSSEILEQRTLLAAVLDAGATLTIELAANEQLSIVSQGTSYAFSSNSQNFVNSGVADAADFTGFGINALTLTDLAQYSTIQIIDAGGGTSVVFNDSGANTYSDAFNITLNNGAAATGLKFNGTSAFGDSPLTASIDTGIQFTAGSLVSTANGGLAFTANAARTSPGISQGISLVSAQLLTTGTGGIVLNGSATQAGPALGSRTGVSITNGDIRSTQNSPGAGAITITGHGGGSQTADYSAGVRLSSFSSISSIYGNISLNGQGGTSGSGSAGVQITGGSLVGSTGLETATAASVTIVGTANSAGAEAIGIQVAGKSRVSTVGGAMTFTGRGGNAVGNSPGIDVSQLSQLMLGSGAMLLDGSAGGGGGSGVRLGGDRGIGIGIGIVANGNANMELRGKGTNGGPDLQILPGTFIGGASASGQLALTAKTIEMTGGVNIDPSLSSSGKLIIRPRTIDASIGLGDGSVGELNLSTTELGYFRDGFSAITIGRTYDGTGAIDVKNAPFKDDVYLFGGTINLDGLNAGPNIATVVSRSGSVTSTAGNPVGLNDVTGPLLVTVGDVAPGGNVPGKMVLNAGLFFQASSSLTLNFNGTTPGTGYDQIAIINPASAVTISGGTNLYINSTFTPEIGQRFRIIDLVDPQSFCNTPFAGWPEGGSQTINGVTYKITYHGGTGNDVVLLVTNISIASINDLGPTLTVPVQFSPTPIAPNATVSGTANFANSRLEVWVTNGIYSDWLSGGAAGWGTFYINGVAKGTINDAEGSDHLFAQFNAAATKEDVEFVLRSITYANGDQNPLQLNKQIAYRLTTADEVSSPIAYKQVQITDTPRLYTDGNIPSNYFAGGSPVTVSYGLRLMDGGANFANSQLRVQLPDGASTERLGFFENNILKLNGNQIFHNDVWVGTFSGGQGQDPLLVDFNANANQDAVILTMWWVTFSDSQASPPIALRNVNFQFIDGHGLASDVVTGSVQIRGNLSLGNGGPNVNYTVGGAPVLVTPDATVAGSDIYFANSRLFLNSSNSGAGNDRFTILTGGDVSVTGTEIRYLGVLVANMSGGQAYQGLTVQFNGDATPAAVQAVLRQAAFYNSSPNANTTFDRKINVYLRDSVNTFMPPLSKLVDVN